MRLLLDTHAFLWWRADDQRLGPTTRAALRDATNEVLVSAVVAWEIVTKRSIGKLTFEGSVAAAVAEEGFTPLPVTLAHIDELALLAWHHRDPFDRLLVATARAERVHLVSADAEVAKYDGFTLVRADA